MSNENKQTDKRVDAGDQLRKIQQRAAKLLRIDRAVKALLPVAISRNVRVANYRENTLIIEACNAAVQLRLRKELPMIERELKLSLLPTLQSSVVRLNPEIANRSEKRGTVSTLSAESGAMLECIAHTASDELQAALKRLAAHSKK